MIMMMIIIIIIITRAITLQNEDTELFLLVLMPHVCDCVIPSKSYNVKLCFRCTVHSIKQASCYHSHSGCFL
jgi:hypothetical protein